MPNRRSRASRISSAVGAAGVAASRARFSGAVTAPPVPSSSSSSSRSIGASLEAPAEVYEARLRLMSRATHREEELCEGDIRGSFAERA